MNTIHGKVQLGKIHFDQFTSYPKCGIMYFVMKIRNDFVSNSSSSSYIIVGSMERSATDNVALAEVISNKSEDESFILVLRNRGAEGDYVFPLTTDLVMDCDIRQIDLTCGCFDIYKCSFIIDENGCGIPSNVFEKRWEEDEWDDDNSVNNTMRKGGIQMKPGTWMYKIERDYGSPRERHEQLTELENVVKNFKDLYGGK